MREADASSDESMGVERERDPRAAEDQPDDVRPWATVDGMRDYIRQLEKDYAAKCDELRELRRDDASSFDGDDALRGRIADTIERKKADDPKELRKRIAELEHAAKTAPKDIERVEVPVIYEPVMRAVAEAVRGLDAMRDAIAVHRFALVEVLAQSEIDGAKVAAVDAPRRQPAPSPAAECAAIGPKNWAGSRVQCE